MVSIRSISKKAFAVVLATALAGTALAVQAAVIRPASDPLSELAVNRL